MPQNLVAAKCDRKGVALGWLQHLHGALEVSGPCWFWGDTSQPWGLPELLAPFWWTSQPAVIYHR